MSRYISYNEYATQKKINSDILLKNCNEGKINGAIKYQDTWLIPDKEISIGYSGTIIFPNNIINISNDLEHLPKKLYDSQMAHFQGDTQLSKKLALELLDETTDIDLLLGSYLILNTIYMYEGDTKEYLKYRKLIENIKIENSKDECKKNTILNFLDTGMYINKIVFNWNELDNFDSLPDSYIHTSCFIYIKLLLINKEIDKLIAVIEPLIINAHYNYNVVLEIYFRLIAVIAYNYIGQKDKANEQLIKSIKLGSKYHIISPFYEYRRDIGKKMIMIADKYDKEFSKEITKEYNLFIPKWIKLYNDLTHRNIVNDLTDREYEVAKYAATGYTNNQIAEIMNISINAVKLYMSNVFTKTGVTKRTQIKNFI